MTHDRQQIDIRTSVYDAKGIHFKISLMVYVKHGRKEDFRQWFVSSLENMQSQVETETYFASTADYHIHRLELCCIQDPLLSSVAFQYHFRSNNLSHYLLNLVITVAMQCSLLSNTLLLKLL